MGIFKHFRGKSRNKDEGSSKEEYTYSTYTPYTNDGRNHIAKLPPKVLARIITFVCPHVEDTKYATSEQSPVGNTCMLCDLRDLGHCAQVNRHWYQLAQPLLYTSIRIDAVHFCVLEEELALKRKKAAKHFRSKTMVEPTDVPAIRLELLCRTLKDNPGLSQCVQIIKLPYTTRESRRSEVAQVVSRCQNLRYVDLPEAVYTASERGMMLRQELQAQCPNIRHMKYRGGSEQQFEYLAHGQWQYLEVLVVSGLDMEMVALRMILASLQHLQDLTLSDMAWVDDKLFEHSQMYADLPSLPNLNLENMPGISAAGLQKYVENPYTRERLNHLSLRNTGVDIAELHSVLWQASALHSLVVEERTTRSMHFTEDMLPLASISLQSLTYEITSSEKLHGRRDPADSYYVYLASSLHAGALPALKSAYVLEPGFPERLLLPPMSSAGRGHQPKPSIGSLSSNTLSMHAPAFAPKGGSFNQILKVYSKRIAEHEWEMSLVTPPSQTRDRTGAVSSARPISAVSASRGLGPQWARSGLGHEARQSVVVGNGFGGFLAVPTNEVPAAMLDDHARAGAQHNVGYESEDDRLQPPPNMASLTGSPKSIAKRGSKHDLWR